MDEHESDAASPGRQALVSRRSLALGAAWSVPVIIAATAAPAAAASVPPAVLTDTGTGTLVHSTSSNYILTLLFTVAGLPKAASTVTVTKVSTVDQSGTTIFFTPVPQSATVSASSPNAVWTVTRQGNDSGKTATILYTVNNGPVLTSIVTVTQV